MCQDAAVFGLFSSRVIKFLGAKFYHTFGVRCQGNSILVPDVPVTSDFFDLQKLQEFAEFIASGKAEKVGIKVPW